jgi:hypothetical protein
MYVCATFGMYVCATFGMYVCATFGMYVPLLSWEQKYIFSSPRQLTSHRRSFAIPQF